MAFFKRSKSDVKFKQPFYRGTTKSGKQKRAGTHVTFNDGKSVTLLTPSGRAEKYAEELKSGIRYTNDGEVKVGADGFVATLSNEQRAYRSGYLAARSDSAKTYKAKNK